MKRLRFGVLGLVCAALMMPGCDEDPGLPELPPRAVLLATIHDTDYVRDRFFRLVAPEPINVMGTNPPLQDDSATAMIARGWSIDVDSIELFVSTSSGANDPNYFQHGVALLDVSGVGWEDFDQAAPPNLEESLDRDDYIYQIHWRRLAPHEWKVLSREETFVGIGLAGPLLHPLVSLACTYVIVDDQGLPVRRVGRSPDLPDPRVDFDTRQYGIDRVYYWKLLRGPHYSVATPRYDLVSEEWGTFDLTWEYQLRNSYQIVFARQHARELDVRIRGLLKSSSPFEDDSGQRPLAQVFGLDQETNAAGTSGPDGRWDGHDPAVYDRDMGILTFPTARPFALSSGELERFAGVSPDAMGDWYNTNPHIYERLETDNHPFPRYFDISVYELPEELQSP